MQISGKKYRILQKKLVTAIRLTQFLKKIKFTVVKSTTKIPKSGKKWVAIDYLMYGKERFKILLQLFFEFSFTESVCGCV